MSFKSFLSAFGHDVKKVADVGVVVEQAANPYIALWNPSVAAALNLGAGVVGAVEKGAATSNATGPQKAAQALALASAPMEQLLANEGIVVNQAQTAKILDAIVAVLNEIPAPTVSAPPA